MTDEQIKSMYLAMLEIIPFEGMEAAIKRARALLADSGKGEAVCWITRDQLNAVANEGDDAWVYWAETDHVAEPDEVPLYLAAPQASKQKRDDSGRLTSDYEPSAHEIEVCRQAIRREFGNNGTDGYYIRILKAVHGAAPQASEALSAEQERKARAIRLLEIAEPILEAAALGKAVTIASGALLRQVCVFLGNAPASLSTENRGEQAECATDEFSSRVCEHGTKCCTVEHAAPEEKQLEAICQFCPNPFMCEEANKCARKA